MSDYLDPNNEELLKDFFAEANGQVETLEQSVLVLENDPGNHDAIDEIFRAAHTLKGGAATVEMTELAEFTHLVEDVLDGIRSGEASVTEALIDALLASIDVIKAMLDARASSSAYRGDISGLKASLASFLPAGAASRAPAAAPGRPGSAPAAVPAAATAQAPAAALSSELSEYELLELREAAGPSRRIFVAKVRFNPDNIMKTVSAIHVFAALRDAATVLKTVPDFERLYEDAFYPEVEYFVAFDGDSEEIRRKAMVPDVVVGIEMSELLAEGAVKASPAVAGKSGAAQPAAPRGQTTSSAPAAQARAAPPAAKVLPAVEHPAENHDEELHKDGEVRKSSAQTGSVLRVDSRRIDNLLNLVSETVINKATFNQISTQFGELMGTLQAAQVRFREGLKDLFDDLPEQLAAIQAGTSAKEIKKGMLEKHGGLYQEFDGFEAELKTNVAKFRSTAQNLGRIAGELQEGVMRIRMVPISQIFSRFPRLVRDLSKSLGKHIELVIEGEDTELDKSVIEDLLDPLMHSVRNAIDHGVEGPEERRAAGKNETGTVLLKASNEGNMIIIEIADDGKGIDVDTVRARAVERGLIHPSKVLTEIEAFNLIFEPGFSTAKAVTNISGRGVGLDVVKRQVEKLNGSVTVSSQRGKGSRFTIKLPLTLAIIQGLLVRVGKEVYSIPITSVIESHRIKPSDVHMIDNYEVFNIRNDVVALLRLNRLFRIQTSEQRDYHFVVIVGTAEKRVGLMVDSLIGEEDVVIKPLRDQYTQSPGIAGASILGDGSVCLIIDVSQLLELGLKRELEERRRLEATIR
ncbi:MAG TPA: chemotaxis protein CheA [Rectinemataceae bacterium]|nr:chemotaxis protein CheA [Rectinemataceae bacterium]